MTTMFKQDLMMSALHRSVDADTVEEILDLYWMLHSTYWAGFDAALEAVGDAQPSDRGYDQMEFDFGN